MILMLMLMVVLLSVVMVVMVMMDTRCMMHTSPYQSDCQPGQIVRHMVANEQMGNQAERLSFDSVDIASGRHFWKGYG